MANPSLSKLSSVYVGMIAAVNGWPQVSYGYIDIALKRIEAGEEECEMLPSGVPKLKALYFLAIKLEGEASPKN